MNCPEDHIWTWVSSACVHIAFGNIRELSFANHASFNFIPHISHPTYHTLSSLAYLSHPTFLYTYISYPILPIEPFPTYTTLLIPNYQS